VIQLWIDFLKVGGTSLVDDTLPEKFYYRMALRIIGL
jgi:hypothetical protein